MNKYLFITIILFGIILLLGCDEESPSKQNTILILPLPSVVTIGNPTAQQVLQLNSEADIFQ